MSIHLIVSLMRLLQSSKLIVLMLLTPMFCALPTLDGFREWVHGPGATVTSTGADAGEVKWLPPMDLIDLFDTCKE